MPCRSEEVDYSQSSLAKDELDKVTQNLCFLCGQIEDRDEWGVYGNPRLKAWWKKHLADDTKRVKNAIQQMLEETPKFSANNVAILLITEAETVHPVSEWHRKWFVNLAEQGKKTFEAIKAKKEQMQTSIAGKLSADEIEFIKHGQHFLTKS